MPSAPISCRELELLAHETLQVHNALAGMTADTMRRRLSARLLELEERFERALGEQVADEELRRSWREHLHGRAPAPREPGPLPMLLFRGRSDAGSEVSVCEADSAGLRIEVDGALVDRAEDRTNALDLRPDGGDGGAWLFRIPGLGEFRETFSASPDAVELLRAWVDDPRGEAPWPALRELAADGLVDRTFALTDRGRRALGRA
jgi:hypothetical protein